MASDVAAQVAAIVGTVMTGISPNSILVNFVVSRALPPPTPMRKSAACKDSFLASSFVTAYAHSPPKCTTSSTSTPAFSKAGCKKGNATDNDVSPPIMTVFLPNCFV